MAGCSKLNKTAKHPLGDNLILPDCLEVTPNVICLVSWFQNGMKHQNGMKTDKVVSFVTAITNYGKVLVVLLYLLQTTVKFWLFCCYICTLITVVFNFRNFELCYFFKHPTIFSQLCQFSSDFDVSYHFGIRRQNQKHWGWI